MIGHLREFFPFETSCTDNLHDLKLDIFIIVLYSYPYEISFALQPHILIHDTRAYIAPWTWNAIFDIYSVGAIGGKTLKPK